MAGFYMQASPLQYRQTAVEQCVEYLCEQGCTQVSGYIEALQTNQELPELARLSNDERMAVLAELTAVMSVYAGKCSR
jgi:hypothetical protein